MRVKGIDKNWKLEERNKNPAEKFYIKDESWKRITQFYPSVMQTQTPAIWDPDTQSIFGVAIRERDSILYS